MAATFHISENPDTYTIADSWGGGAVLAKPATESDVHAWIENYIADRADEAADELIDELGFEFESEN